MKSCTEPFIPAECKLDLQIILRKDVEFSFIVKTSINFPLGLMIKVSVGTFLKTKLILLYERKEVFLS